MTGFFHTLSAFSRSMTLRWRSHNRTVREPWIRNYLCPLWKGERASHLRIFAKILSHYTYPSLSGIRFIFSTVNHCSMKTLIARGHKLDQLGLTVRPTIPKDANTHNRVDIMHTKSYPRRQIGHTTTNHLKKEVNVNHNSIFNTRKTKYNR